MKKKHKLIVLLVFVLILSTEICFSAESKRIALVIGNGSYKSAPLKNPTNDAQDIAYVLKELEFNVTLKLNAGKTTIKKSIRNFGKELRHGGVGLFYFAGHGLQVKGRNYLLPVDADIDSEADVEYEAVDAGRVLAQMEEAQNNINIIILDACRNNPFKRRFRSSSRGLARMHAPVGSYLAYSTEPGSIAADGIGRNSIFTKYLLKHIQTPGIGLEKVFKNVRIDVAKASRNKQIPWDSSSLMGDFYFNPEQKTSFVKSQSISQPKVTNKSQKLASLSPKVIGPKIIAQDNKFVKYASGITYIKNASLEWYAGPDKNMTWKEAKKWVEALNIDGGGWSMPSNKDLSSLYQNLGYNNYSKILNLSGWWVWSRQEASELERYGYDFKSGSVDYFYMGLRNNARALAVRKK